jgi:hypothetical protein
VPALLAVVSLAIGCVLYVDERRNRRPAHRSPHRPGTPRGGDGTSRSC